MTDDDKAELEASAYFLTLLMLEINSKINPDETMEIITEFLVQGMTSKDAIRFGQLINATSLPVSGTKH